MYSNTLLIDTQIMIWLEQDFEKIPANIIDQIKRADQVYFSSVSVWEMAIKIALSKLEMKRELNLFVESFARDYNCSVSDINLSHIYYTQTLPHHHKNPFDRLIAAQCLVQDLPLVSADQIFDAYKVSRLW